MRYFPVYKCSLCDCLVRATNQSYEARQSDLPAMIGRVISNQQFMINPYLSSGIVPMQVIHHCKGGGVGVASFAGFLPENTRRRIEIAQSI